MNIEKRSKSRVWTIGFIEILRYWIILFALGFGYFIRGYEIWNGSIIDYLFLLVLFVPLPTTFDKKGIHWIFFRNWEWSKIKYYKLKNRSVELFDKNKKLVHVVGFIYQSNLKQVLKKYCKPLK